jgi:hypothetical protein
MTARWTFQSFCVARPSIHRCALPRDRMAYLSKLIGADRDAVIRWFVLCVAVLLDPLAITLLRAANTRE